MISWFILILMASTVFGAILWAVKPPRGVSQALAATLMLGMAGYALQGRPTLLAAPAKPSSAQGQEAAAFITMRAEMDDPYGPAKNWLVTADAFARSGNYRLSSSFIQSGLKENPRSADLWAALGVQLFLAGEGRMSTPALYAFDRARTLAPDHPAPDYFAGLATLFEGNVEGAKSLWGKLLDNAPKRAKWRPRLESQYAGLLQIHANAGSQDIAKPVTN